MKRSILALLLAIAFMLSGCGEPGEPIFPTSDDLVLSTPASHSPASDTSTSDSPGGTVPSAEDIFSNRDKKQSYDTAGAITIRLNGDSIACNSGAVKISGTTVALSKEGTYILSGQLDDGMILIDAPDSHKLQLVLDGVSIHSESCAPIYIRQADKVFLTLATGSSNTLSNGGGFTAIDENNIDAVIFSKEDLTLNGSGALTITSPAGHGIVSKDSLKITAGTYDIQAASHGIAGKDDVCISGADFTITAGKDGIHSENNDDETLGFVYLESGNFVIDAQLDGISASSGMTVLGGNYNITAGGGSANGESHTESGFGGGFGGPGGGHGGRPGGSTQQTEETTESRKGFKAAGDLAISGGVFAIDSADDALHANANITLSGGSFQIASGDDGVHADETLTVTAGTMDITESYEGLEALHIIVSGGQVSLVASDDGLNAAGGTDSSGFGGGFGGDRFGGNWGGSTGSSGSIVISGGELHIQASGDGIDANGTLDISGGFITVCGPTQGDTATLDYDTRATITGGIFIGTGAMGMAQTFSDNTQGVIAVRFGSQSAGTQISVLDSSGKVILTHSPELSFAVAIISSPQLVSGQTYTLQLGTFSGEVTAD